MHFNEKSLFQKGPKEIGRKPKGGGGQGRGLRYRRTVHTVRG
jgi:hypothetical protein